MGLNYVFVTLVAIYLIFAARVDAVDLNTVVGLWLFDEGRDDVVADSSENGNDGDIIQCKWVDGKFGDALEFTGSGYVQIPPSDSLNSIADEITIMAWVKFIDLSNWARIITRGVFQDKDNLQFIFCCTDNPEFVSLELHSQGRVFAIWTQHVLETDAWHHIAYTSDGAQVKLYRDGELKVTGGSGKPLNKVDDKPLFFGSGVNAPGGAPGSAQKFRGVLDEVAMFNKALSEDDIKKLMQGLEGISHPVESRGKLSTAWGSMKVAYSGSSELSSGVDSGR